MVDDQNMIMNISKMFNIREHDLLYHIVLSVVDAENRELRKNEYTRTYRWLLRSSRNFDLAPEADQSIARLSYTLERFTPLSPTYPGFEYGYP